MTIGPPDVSERMLTPNELAERWAMHAGTLANWRMTGHGPQFLHIGANIRYKLSAVVAYEQGHTSGSGAA